MFLQFHDNTSLNFSTEPEMVLVMRVKITQVILSVLKYLSEKLLINALNKYVYKDL